MNASHSAPGGARRAFAAFGAAAALLLAGCATTPKPIEIGETLKATARVEAVDPASRLIVLKTPDGGTLVTQAGPEVRNLAQVRPGDNVVVAYREALAARVVKSNAGVGTVDSGVAASRASPGERPGAGVVDFVRTTVTVFDVDTAQNVIEVTGPRGYNRRIKVNDPEARQFIRGLKRGDLVEVTFTEAIAVSVEPAGR